MEHFARRRRLWKPQRWPQCRLRLRVRRSQRRLREIRANCNLLFIRYLPPPPKGLTHRQHQRSDRTWFSPTNAKATDNACAKAPGVTYAKALSIRHFISQHNFDNLVSGLRADVSLSHLCCVTVFDRAYHHAADCDDDAFKPP